MTTLEILPARASQTRRRTRIQREKSEIILDAALDVFSVRGFAAATVDDVAAAAGMSKPNLLYYFARKDDIYAALLDRLLEDWLTPMEAINPNGDPIEELGNYLRLKLRMAQTNPRESRLFANEMLHGAPHIRASLEGPLHALIDRKAAAIQTWIDAGRLKPVDPKHLIFAIWATTQHYADFDVQVRALLKADDDAHFETALKTLEMLFLDGLKVD